MKKLFIPVACCVAVLMALPAEATMQLPSYAQDTGVQQAVQTKGKAFTDLISMIVAILAIIGMLIGAGYYGVGNGEQGKKYLIGGVVALIIAGSVYGIATLAIN
jgi:hypothetical protein